MLDILRSRLKGKVIVLGIGNTLRSDDGCGSIIANRIKGRVAFTVFDAGTTPENYLDKIIREKPDTVVIIDAVDFGGSAGEFKILDDKQIQTANLFSTHNASISMAINYLKNSLPVDIIILIIQPKNINFGDRLSPELSSALEKLESLFIEETKDA